MECVGNVYREKCITMLQKEFLPIILGGLLNKSMTLFMEDGDRKELLQCLPENCTKILQAKIVELIGSLSDSVKALKKSKRRLN